MTKQPDPYLAALAKLERGDVQILVMDQDFSLHEENRGYHIRVGAESEEDITVTLTRTAPKGAQYQLEVATDGEALLHDEEGAELHGWGSKDGSSYRDLGGKGSITRLLVVENLTGDSAKYVITSEQCWA